jgi:hypothetical protein
LDEKKKIILNVLILIKLQLIQIEIHHLCTKKKMSKKIYDFFFHSLDFLTSYSKLIRNFDELGIPVTTARVIVGAIKFICQPRLIRFLTFLTYELKYSALSSIDNELFIEIYLTLYLKTVGTRPRAKLHS